MRAFFVFDVESIGLHGEGFAVAGGVYLENGAVQWEFCFCCHPENAEGNEFDRKWVTDNVPVIEITHRTPAQLRLAFWGQWVKAWADKTEMAAECLWPVEARFLRDCIADDSSRFDLAPYPVHEISSIMLAAGMDPMATYTRTPSELPKHNPLADARQSARLLSEALCKLAISETRSKA